MANEITWGEWEGRGVGSSNSESIDDGWCRCAYVDGEFVAMLHHAPAAPRFYVTVGQYPSEYYRALSSRKRETAEREAEQVIRERLDLCE